MEPVLNEQQNLLRDSAVRLCRSVGGPKRARQLRNDAIELDAAAWKQMVAAGWVGTAVPEAEGGLGLGTFELSLAMEEAGRQLLAVPLVEASAAAWAIARAERRSAGLLEKLIDGSALVVPALSQEGWSGAHASVPLARGDSKRPRLDGRLSFIPYAPSASDFLVLAADDRGESLLCVIPKNAAGVSAKTVVNVDGSTASELTLADAALDETRIIARSDRARELASQVQTLLVLGASAELVGVASAALDMTLDYIKLRQQFGKPLGSFQALQHRCADRFVDIELNRSLVYRVFSAWDTGQAHPAMASAAKARSSRCALETTRTALQFHGAIGYTDEHDIGLYYKRAMVLAALYGNESNHTTRFSRLTLAAS